MIRKFVMALLILLLTSGLAITGPFTESANAQGSAPNDGFAVSIEFTGVIATITPRSEGVYLVTLQDGTTFLINPATRGNATVVPGQMIIAVAELNDPTEHGPLVAKTLDNYVPPNGPTATFVPTQPPTPTALVLPTQGAPGPVATQSAQCADNEPDAQPVAQRLAQYFDVPYQEIMGWHCRGFGFGEIARAYLIDERGTLTVEDIFNMRISGVGWGQIMKESDVNPSELAPGQIIKAHDFDKNGKHKPKKPKKVKGNNGNGNNGKKGDNGGD